MKKYDQKHHIHRIPLKILVIGWHEHNPGYGTMALMNHFRIHDSVVAFGTVERFELAKQLIRKNAVNTIFLDLRVGRYYGSPNSYGGPDQVDPSIKFIKEIRTEFPHIVFVLFTDKQMHDAICAADPRFRHYFYLENGYSEYPRLVESEIDEILMACEEWHDHLFQYDIALSFAGEDREIARSLADSLHSMGARVFFDEYQKSSLLGSDLFLYLYDIYSEKSRYCVILQSRNYLEKMWTIHERRAAQERTLKERGADYVLPVRIDDTKLPRTDGNDWIRQYSGGYSGNH